MKMCLSGDVAPGGNITSKPHYIASACIVINYTRQTVRIIPVGFWAFNELAAATRRESERGLQFRGSIAWRRTQQEMKEIWSGFPDDAEMGSRRLT